MIEESKSSQMLKPDYSESDLQGNAGRGDSKFTGLL
jgi:hypothetical protein